MDIPGYKIIRELGRGGMAIVYLAMQERLEREVALKVLSPSLSDDSSYTDRFLKERRINAKLNHPNIVTVFDSGVVDNYHYLVMELLPAGTLEERIRQGLQPTQVLTIAKAIAAALAYAHKQGLVHRDIKPQNILFRDPDTPVLTDFGIAKLLESNTQLTKTGSVIGSTHYMSPEQIKQTPVDGRSDLYSFGVVFYKMLTGQLPYDGDNIVAIALKHMSAPIPELPPHLANLQPILEKLLAKEASDRFADANAFLNTLTGYENYQRQDATATMPVGYSPSDRAAKPATPMHDSVTETTPIDLQVATPVPVESHENTPPPRLEAERASGKRLAWVWLAGGAMVIVLALVSAFMFLGDEQPSGAPVADYYLAQATQLFEQNRLQESLDQIELGLRIIPEHEKLLDLRAAVQARREELQQQAREQEQREQQVTAALNRAKQLQAAGKLEESLAALEPGLQAMPQNRDLLALQQQLKTTLEQQRQAEERARLEQRAAAALAQARQLQAEGKLEESLAALESGLQAMPQNNDLLALQTAIQNVLAEQKQREQRVAVALDRAEQLRAEEQFERSLTAIEQGLEAMPENARLLALRDLVRDDLQKQQQAAAERARREQAAAADKARREQTATQALAQAEQLQTEGNFKQSLTVIAQGLEAMPQDGRLLALRDLVRNDLERQQQAEKTANQALAQAERLRSQGQLEQSLAAIEQGLEAMPQQAGLLALRTEVQNDLEQQRREAAEQERRQRVAADALAEAEQLFTQRQYQQSLIALGRGLAAVADDTRLLALRDRVQAAQAEQWQREQAQAQLQREQEQRERAVLAALSLAEELRKQQRIQDSLSAVRQGLQTAPQDSRLLTLQTQLQAELEQQQQREQERLQQERAVLAALSLAQQLQAKQRFEESLAALEQGLQSAPQDTRLLELRQRIREQLSRPDPTAARIAELLQNAQQQLERSRLTVPAGDNAFESFSEVLKLDPQNEQAKRGLTAISDKYLALVERETRRGDLQKGLTYIDRALEVTPDYQRLNTMRSEILAKIEQQRQEARERAERAERDRAARAERERAERDRAAAREAQRQQEAEQQRREQQQQQLAREQREREAAAQREAERRAAERQRKLRELEQAVVPPAPKEDDKPIRTFGGF